MFKIKPLNRDSISDDDVPLIRKEAQEENALAKYNKALKLQCNNEYSEAEHLLQSLLSDDIPEMEHRGGLPKTMSTLKYSCYLNIGTIASNLNDKQSALDNFSHASDLDKTDVTLWFKIGALALELNHFKQSAFAFSRGLDCNKNHWPTLDKLITLLYAMRDTVSCLHYISRGLQLDPDYVRGLMLRKRIYETNPATVEYYQLFNPDYIYEPALSTDFDLTEGEELELESLKIASKIRDLELQLETTPLPTLNLNKPLQEYTWLALGISLTQMHQHITENNHSYISRINLLENISSEAAQQKDPESYKMCVENTLTEPEATETKPDEIPNAPMEVDVVQEPESDIQSENPENASDDTETEGDKDDKPPDLEEQTSKSTTQEDDILADTPEEESKECSQKTDEVKPISNKESVEEKAKVKTPNRRRRNSLSFLQPWAWHSKRKSSRKLGKNDKDDTIEGALRRIIPINILPNGLKSDRIKQLNAQHDGSLDTMDIYKLFVEDAENNSALNSTETIDNHIAQAYFGTQLESEHVQTFWTTRYDRCDIITLIENYITQLSEYWELEWPTPLRTIYIEAYEMHRNHSHHPHIFTDTDFQTLKTDAELTLLYSELIFDTVQTTIHNNEPLGEMKHLPCESLNFLDLICAKKHNWGSGFTKINLRLHWMKANIYMVELKHDLAIQSLNTIICLISNESDCVLRLPNCAHNNQITLQIAEKLVKSLEMLQKLSNLDTYFEHRRFGEVVEILQETFHLKSLTRFKTKTDRPVQLVMLLHALWLTNKQDCFIWCEISLNESLPMYLKTHAQPDSFEHKRWSLVVVKCMLLMESCIKDESIIVLDFIQETQTRLVENLTSIICHQLNSKTLDNQSKMPLETIKPWILLHYVLQREEHRVQAKRNVRHCKNSDDSDDETRLPQTQKSDDSEEDEEQEVPASVQILITGHEFLGRRGWCLESGGELLLFLVDTILYRLNAPIFESIREKLEIRLEQAFFCLYQHPSKKNKVSRHLADHNVDPLPLTWNHAQQLYEFYQPKALPEFDSYRYSSISSEMEQLLQRILALVPRERDPLTLVPKISDFVNGNSDLMPDAIEFPYKVSAIYYLLGDYYLKQHDPAKGLKYFLLDLCINPTRLDTWADMALAMASQLETKLNHCESFRHEAEFFEKAKSAQICFKQSLQLSNGHSMLWIEYGNFVYMAHSFCSRLLKGDTDMFSMEKFESLESQKEAMLDTASECFTAANISWQANEHEPGEHDERWLHHYMLGKIAEKKKQDPAVYLEHYSKAAKFLFENKATYPIKINYSNPQNLSVEALEIHYRIHASILKYLELHEDKPIARCVGRVFQKYLKETDNGLFSKPSSKTDQEATSLKRNAIVVSVEGDVKKPRLLEPPGIDSDVACVVEELLVTVERSLVKLTPDVVVIDSDDEAKPHATVDDEPVKVARLRVKNAQEIMDDMMKQCMANQPEYKSETDTDHEMEVDKIKTKKVTETTSSPSRRGSTTSTAATTTTSNSSSSSSSSSEDSSDTSDSDSESSETENSKQSTPDNSAMTVDEIKKLIDPCLLSLEQCISRFPQNYKALYRLTHFYLNNKQYKNLNKCRQLMLTEYKCVDSSSVVGLFSERRNNNFFNGVWRIPTSEIDRPGSFASHMSRCVQLLMQVLRDSDDHKTLLDLCLLLRRTPDPDKIYIRDSERQQLADQALSICVQSLRGIIKRFLAKESDGSEGDVKILLDIYRAYLKVQKHLAHKETVFTGLLTDAYRHIVQNKLDGNVLEAAVKFCQQRKAIIRPVIAQQSPAAKHVTPQIIPTTSPGVATQATPRKATKTHVGGRPRGRPPNINKHLTGAKSKPIKDNSFYSPSNPYAWQNLLYSTAMGGNIDPKIALNYMMSKYQEELIRQYSSQMGQQNALLNTNPFAANLMQSNILNNPALTTQNFKDFKSKPVDAKERKETTKPFASQLIKELKHKQTKQCDGKGVEGKRDTNIRYSKEANKAYYGESSKSLFKDRPGISITPIHQSTPKQKPPKTVFPTSPSKTLQQKLAERQKGAQIHQTPAIELFNQYQRSINFAKPNPLPPVPHNPKLHLPNTYKNLNKSSMPSQLTIIKSQPSISGLQSGDSGVSITPHASYKQDKLLSFRKPNAPKLKQLSRKLGNDITVTPNYKLPDLKTNIPLSLSITKKEDNKPDEAKKDNVEIITIE